MNKGEGKAPTAATKPAGAKIASRTKAATMKVVGTCPQCGGDLILAMVSPGVKTRGRMTKVCEKNADHRYAK